MWTREAVLALAPDAASVQAAAKLVGSITADGCDDGAVWGSCAGSGKTPYQTVVDLTGGPGGPAYKCSCPSRKFPCKHALALLLRWSAGDVPAAAARRSQRRAERVGAGLAELDVWLTDQVRTGLAGAAQAGYAYGAATAARMVDAQAPGVASTLRRLPRAVVSGDGWTGRLLTELALLRLLVAAHGRLDDLTEDEAAVVRAHVGYPVRAEDVLAREPLRDHWAVTGVRDVLTDALTARRVWLRGRRTGHAALVLTFTPSGQAPDASLPVGTVVDADLHFHPGTPELRAVVGTRHAEPVPLTDLAPCPAREAVAEFQRAVTLDPWTRHWPVVVSGVVPVAGERGPVLVGPDGTLPVDVGGADVWRLLAVSGGHPVTVTGELGDRGLRPTGVLGGVPGSAPGGGRRLVAL